jgi:hypothetical protein
VTVSQHIANNGAQCGSGRVISAVQIRSSLERAVVLAILAYAAEQDLDYVSAPRRRIE